MVAAAIGTQVRDVAVIIHDLLHEGFPVLHLYHLVHLDHLVHLVHLGQLGEGRAGLHGADDGEEDQKSQGCKKQQKFKFKTSMV